MKRGCFNKKGQELSIGTLVLIVLGVIVLVLLVLGFSIGWENLFSKIGIVQGSDLSAMISACKVAVASQSQSSYCEFKIISVNSGKEYLNCEDTRVVLENKLSSCNTEQVMASVKFCNSLKAADPKIKTKVNNGPCEGPQTN